MQSWPVFGVAYRQADMRSSLVGRNCRHRHWLTETLLGLGQQ